MSEDAGEEKTQEASPEKRRKTREEEGQFARARDTGSMAASLGVLALVMALGEDMVKNVRNFAARCFHDPGALTGNGIHVIAQECIVTLLALILPIVGVAIVAGVAACVAEAGFHPNFDLASPKFERLEPTGKLGQMFSPKAAALSTSLALGRVAVVALVTWYVVKPQFPRLQRLSTARLADSVLIVAEVLGRLALWCTLALAILTAIDYATAWFKHEKSIMMTREEAKNEMEQQEGDPRLKARMRSKAREIVRRGLKQQIEKSDVIIANPTHIAIAIRYRAAEGAPIVMAKGFDDVALHMKEVAKEAGLPIVENRPLARALSAVRAGKSIPVELFSAVAEVLAFVYRLKGRGRRA
jgi:flagellar biosynthesis protein FlhB